MAFFDDQVARIINVWGSSLLWLLLQLSWLSVAKVAVVASSHDTNSNASFQSSIAQHDGFETCNSLSNQRSTVSAIIVVTAAATIRLLAMAHAEQ